MNTGAPTYRATLRELAYGNHGYVTANDAADVGVPRVELAKIAQRGGLERIAYGLYRVPDIPTTPEAQFAEAVLRAGPSAFLRGESVLAVLGLGHVNPRKITVGVTKRVRRSLPNWMVATRAEPDTATTRYEGIRAQRVADAIWECIGRVPAAQLRDAATRARDEGYLSHKEWDRVRRAVRRAAA